MFVFALLACAGENVEDFDNVERVVVRATQGAVEIAGREDARATVDGSFGGASLNESSLGQLNDGVLTVNYTCSGTRTCSAPLAMEIPADADLSVVMEEEGDIRLVGLSGNISASIDSSGEFQAEEMRATHADVLVYAGNVQATWETEPEHLQLTAVNGDIWLSVPDDTEGEALELSAPNGQITLD